MFCSFDAPNKDRVGAHNPVTPAGVAAQLLQNEFAGIQTASKHVRMSRAHTNKLIQNLRRMFSHSKWFLACDA